jgi:pimeloyl-ACP methyl ester carboxylesterase
MKQTFVLVHGAFADSHAFDAVKPRLEALGHTVLAPDLPGHGEERTPVANVTFESYVASVAALIAAQATPVVLVAHSMAGMVAAQVAERIPGHLKQLLFVAAYLPRSGQSLEELAKDDPESLVGKHMEFAPDWSSVTVKREHLAEAIAADLSPELQALIVANHAPEPLAPFRGVVSLGDGFASVPRAYIFTTKDRAVTPALQERMVAAWPHTKTVSLDTSHLPFLAQPGLFVEAVLNLSVG